MNDVALIVGGSSGMGKAVAQRLLKRGVPVWLISSSEAKLASAATELGEAAKVRTDAVDLADEQAVGAFTDELRAAVDLHIKYLVNAAGTLTRNPSWSTPRRITTSTWPHCAALSSSRKRWPKT